MNALTVCLCIWATTAFCALMFIRGATRPMPQREDCEQHDAPRRRAGLFTIHYRNYRTTGLDVTAR
jgi:hypothetical protein